MSKTTRIWIFRHAQRDHSAPDQSDPGLSRDGQLQARSIADYLFWLKKEQSASFQIYGSPRRRSQETLQPACDKLSQKLLIDPLLDERQSPETSLQFHTRVGAWVRQCEERKPLHHLVVCSHLDWLEEVLRIIPSDTDLTDQRFATWPTARYLEFSLTSKMDRADVLWKFEAWRSLP